MSTEEPENSYKDSIVNYSKNLSSKSHTKSRYKPTTASKKTSNKEFLANTIPQYINPPF